MKIGLVDVDSHNFPNLALMKISAWHKAQGDTVEWCFPMSHYDIVYQSKVFDDTYSPDIDWMPMADKIIKGGTGYGLDNHLPDEIEHIYPDYSIYPDLTKDTAYGFLTRGCPRGCDFCIVAEKEGRRSYKVADLSEFWRGQKKIVLLDPNILACKDRMNLLGQLIESKAIVDFSQGLDIRLTDEEVAEKLNRIRVKRLHFAWDNPDQDLTPFFKRFTESYNRKNCAGKVVYTLVNFNSTMEQSDIVHCLKHFQNIGGYIKQVKRIEGDSFIVGTAYADESKDFEFEAGEILGVVIETYGAYPNYREYIRPTHLRKKKLKKESEDEG